VIPEPPEAGDSDKALVLVVYGGEAVWFVVDKDEELKPPTMPTPKSGTRK
jgi:hypothetical protein